MGFRRVFADAASAAVEGLALLTQFRTRGHLHARLDPLERCVGPLSVRWPPNIDQQLTAPSPSSKAIFPLASQLSSRADALRTGDSSEAELKPSSRVSRRHRMVYVGRELVHVRRKPWWRRDELLAFLRSTYCDTIGFETEHLVCHEQRSWWRRAAEIKQDVPLPTERKELLERLLRSTLFEQCLAAKYASSKRFGLDGCEALIPGLLRLFDRSATKGVRLAELGMAHRGRLNVLHNLLGKPMGLICAEMKENVSEFHVGDVKYHLGTSGVLSSGMEAVKPLRVNISPNPSHLEAVGPVVMGKVRAEQDRIRAEDGDVALARRQVMGVLIHGDAAFAGLGISLETLQLSDLPGYGTGGCIHVVLNNQIGFTTEPFEARSSPHPSDVAVGLGLPVMHVNADDIEAVDRVFRLAADFRATFHRDVVVDLVGYRRFGHNELDDPKVTQPCTYQLIKNHPTTLDIYERKLVGAQIMEACEVEARKQTIRDELDAEYAERYQHKLSGMDWLRNIYGGRANRLWAKNDAVAMPQTGINLETLQKVGNVICTIPEDFVPHKRVVRVLERRKGMIKSGGRIDFATAELLAFGSILLHKDVWRPDGFVFPHKDVRLSGQDSKRGSFNQRHATVIDHKTTGQWIPLDSMVPGQQAHFSAYNSPLSEMAVLAFEYGYSLGNPDALVCWEAQFGDFANNAQVAIDQFIASGEERWGQTSSIVLMLPHGYDGQGPDHSSARLERFLQLVNDDPDYLPGANPQEILEIERAFDLLNVSKNDFLEKDEVVEYLSHMSELQGSEFQTAEEAWAEMRAGRECNDGIDRTEWRAIMQQWYRRNAEARANIIVANVSTPAQYFHVLRRHAHRRFKKPLIIMAPKYLLHHVKATSAFEDFGPGTFFRRVIVDYTPYFPVEAGRGDNTRHLAVTAAGVPLIEHPERIRRLILCSGQMYYKLSNCRQGRKIKDVSILRLEQIAPFPHDRITETISLYPNADVVWCQEEPKNMGAWFYVQPRLTAAMRELSKRGGRHVEVRYVGRPVAAATATGSSQIHQEETRQILDTVFAH